MAEFVRRSSRVLVLDAKDRLLLFSCRTPVERYGVDRAWFTPGGGVDKGETLRETAVRELREETGLVIDLNDLGPHVAMSAGINDWGWLAGRMRDDYFVHRVESHDVDVSGLLDYETANTLGHRWWTLDEMTATDEKLCRNGLIALITRILAGDVPDEPVELPWEL